jgi:hypothetical protein
MELTKLGFLGTVSMGGKVAIKGLCEAVGGLEITSGSDSV